MEREESGDGGSERIKTGRATRSGELLSKEELAISTDELLDGEGLGAGDDLP